MSIDNTKKTLYTNWQAPLYKSSLGTQKYRDLTLNSRFMDLEEFPVIENDRRMIVCDSVIGWIPVKYVEPYIENYPKNCVDMQCLQTPDENDAEQFVIANKVKQTNLCGELSICYVLGLGLKDYLDTWGIKNVPLWKRIFGQGKARGTGDGELVELLSFYDVAAIRINQSKWTPNSLFTVMEKSSVICSVSIDCGTGRLRGSGVGHWVVPTKIIMDRCGYGLIELYNPFPNRIEVYSWNEFLASAKMPYGCIIYK